MTNSEFFISLNSSPNTALSRYFYYYMVKGEIILIKIRGFDSNGKHLVLASSRPNIISLEQNSKLNQLEQTVKIRALNLGIATIHSYDGRSSPGLYLPVCNPGANSINKNCFPTLTINVLSEIKKPVGLNADEMTLFMVWMAESMTMIKNIVFLLALMLSGITCCAATEPDSLQLDNLNSNRFNIGKITDREITDNLSHSTCTLRLANNKGKDFYNYIEGAICPVGGRECTYSAIIKLNGKITILKQISSEKNSSLYKNNDISISITQTPMIEPNDDEGSDVKAIIILKTNHGEKTLTMTGYCGV
ncbi:hypothetical protein [Kluyvera sichuanensis]